MLAVWSWGVGFAYGAIINLWSWPLTPGPGDLQWRPGLGLQGTLEHYWSFYVATSLGYGFAYAGVLLVLSALVFRRRDFL